MKNILPTLIKREFRENRSLWIAPLATAGVLLLLSIVGAAYAGTHFDYRWPVRGGAGGFSPLGASAMAKGMVGFATQLFFISSITCGFYLLDCLYAERKDRSILFWKSLPVSDLQTVASKFLVAMAVVPLAVFALATVLYPVLYGIAALGIPDFTAITGGWNFAAWLRAEVAMFVSMVVTLLWYAPLAAWSMLASVFSRRSPIMVSLLPVVILGIVEGIVFRSSHVWKYLFYRLMPIVDPAQGIARPGLWIGLAVAAGMLYIVVRLRRYRDDT